MDNNKKVAAVVVTYNRLQLLKECVYALRVQSYPLSKIIVVNNSSTDGTAQWLKEQSDVDVIELPNEGGAPGFFAGIKTAFEKGYEWIWCMDDDGYPKEDALEKLLEYRHRKPCVINTLVCDKNNTENLVFKTGKYVKQTEIAEDVIEGAANFFNGTLINREIIRDAGLPIGKMVIWGDESEYYNRIRYQFKMDVFTVVKSIHFHPAQSGVFYKKEWDINKDWKPYFFIRNKIFVFGSRYTGKVRTYIAYTFFLVGFFGSILLFQKKNRFRKTKLLVMASCDGYSKNMTKSIQGVINYLTNKV